MSDQDPIIPDEDAAAGEYVLGLLEGEALLRARGRLTADPAFAFDVEAWEARFAPLTETVTDVTPPTRVWARVEAGLEGASNVISFSTKKPALVSTVGFWRGATAASLALAAASLLVVVMPRPPAPTPIAAPAAPTAVLAATLADASGKPLYAATLDPDRRGVTIIPLTKVKLGDRTPELWVIPTGGAPKPVGLMKAGGPHLVSASPAILSQTSADVVMAVSLEPAGGSPTGLPTGPVIATGKLTAL
jgi:anti-sigma-K factor RskA